MSQQKNNDVLNEVYERELDSLRARMLKAMAFAEKVPLFKDHILVNKIAGEEAWTQFGTSYKKIPLRWGINRGLYSSCSRRTVTNYAGDYSEYLWNIYINTITLFDVHEEFGLEEVIADLDLFFYDRFNTTFYATDEQIEPLLEALNDWYIAAAGKLAEYHKQKELESLKRRLAKLEGGE